MEEVEVWGCTGKRGRGIESFVRQSTNHPSRRIFSLFLTSFELMQGPVSQGGAKLHACESGAASKAASLAMRKVKQKRVFWRCFAFRRLLPVNSSQTISDGEETKNEKERGFRKRLCDRFTLPLLLRFPNAVLSPHIPVLPHSRTPGDKGKGTAASARRSIDVVDRRRRRRFQSGRIQINPCFKTPPSPG